MTTVTLQTTTRAVRLAAPTSKTVSVPSITRAAATKNPSNLTNTAPKAAAATAAVGTSVETARADHVHPWSDVVAPVLVDLTFNIPTDHATLQAAIDALNTRPVKQGARIILNIESGHQPASGLFVERGDFSHFEITSSDAEVVLAAGFPAGESVFKGENCRMPVVNVLVDAQGRGDRGYWITRGATGRILTGAGVKNAGGDGLLVDGASTVFARNSNFSGATGIGGWITRASHADVEDADFSGTQGSIGLTSRVASIVAAEGVNLANCAAIGAYANRAFLSLSTAVVTGCGTTGISASSGGIAMASLVDVSGAGSNGVSAFNGGVVDFDGGTADNCNIGVTSRNGGIVNADGATATGNAIKDLHVIQGGTISAHTATTTNGVGSPAIADTNVSAFNVTESGGLIYSDDTAHRAVAFAEVDGRAGADLVGTWHVIAAGAAGWATSATVETALRTVTVPGGALGPNGVVRVTTQWKMSGTAGLKRRRIRLGGPAGVAYLNAASSAVGSHRDQRQIHNRNSEASQVGGSSATASSWDSVTTGEITSSVATAADFDVVLAGLVDNAADTVELLSYVVEILHVA